MILLFSTSILLFSFNNENYDETHDETISLAGDWKFQLDPENIGMTEKWFTQTLPDRVQLPGSLDEQGAVTEETQTNWNGIIGEIKLIANPPILIKDIQVYPNFEDKTAKVLVGLCQLGETLIKKRFNCFIYHLIHRKEIKMNILIVT